MANYYFNSYEMSSKLTFKDKAKYLNTVGGSFRGVLEGNLQAELSLTHKTQVNTKDAFLAYYVTNKNNDITVEYGGTTYTMKFKIKPITIPLGGDMWKISVKLIGVV